MVILGIDDPGVWLAYLLCIASAVFCVIYGMLRWNTGDEAVYPEDIKWVKDEKIAEEDL